MFDCVGLLHPEFVAELAALGGVSAIAISHPHFYTACADWAEGFDCKVGAAAQRWSRWCHAQQAAWRTLGGLRGQRGGEVGGHSGRCSLSHESCLPSPRMSTCMPPTGSG